MGEAVGALVTDAGVRSSVWVARGLVADGVPVLALGKGALAAAGWTRGIRARVSGPDPATDPAGFRMALEAAARRYGPQVAYPGTEESLDALAGGPLAGGVQLPYPSADGLAVLRDKSALAPLAEAAGLSPPRILYSGPAGALPVVEGSVVLKPLRKGGALRQVHVISGAGQLASLAAALPPDEHVLVQERVAGHLLSVAVVVDRDGRLVARFQQLARATWPDEAGPSRIAVSVPPDEDTADRVRALLGSTGFWGLAQVQFIATPAGPRLIDVNPRGYGSISLALAAGLNLPALWHRVALGERLPAPSAYAEGVTYRWLEADVYAALHGDVRSLLRRSPSPRVGAFWSAADPVPGVLLSAGSAASWAARQAGRLRRPGRGADAA